MSIQLVRTVMIYLSVIVAIRLMGKRQIGELSPSELVVTLMISELAAVPMQDTGTSVLIGLLPIGVLISIEIILSAIAVKSQAFRTLLSGKVVPVVENGKIKQKNLRALRQTVDDLMEELRLKDVFDLNMVTFAQVETNGQLSVLISNQTQNAPSSYSVILISDGKLSKEGLKTSGRTREWVDTQLKLRGISNIKNVFLLAVDRQDRITFLENTKDNLPEKKDNA